MIRKIDAGVVVPNIGAQVPGEQRMLLRRIVSENKNSRSGSGIGDAGQAMFLASQCADERDIIRGAMMVDIICAKSAARNLLQKIGFFIRDARRADHADAGAAAFVAMLHETAAQPL